MPTRYRHYVRAAKRQLWPSAIVCVDCVGSLSQADQSAKRKTESLVSWHAVCLSRKGERYGVTRCVSGRERSDWWRVLAEQCASTRNTWLVSYRCSRVWALLGLWEELEDERWTVTGTNSRMDTASGTTSAGGSMGYLVIEDTPNIARIKPVGAKHWCQWIDSRNHGVEVASERLAGPDTASWLAEQFRQLTSALVDYRLGALQVTTGSQAMHGWRTGYLSHGVYCHADEGAGNLERAGYFGGRCECFRIGAIAPAVHHLDYRSAYAAICERAPVPIRLVCRVHNPCEADATRALERGESIATVALETTEPAYPYRRGNRVTQLSPDSAASHAIGASNGGTDIIYPVGRFYTTLCGPELTDAYRHNRIRKVIEYATYELAPALSAFASAVYSLRLQAERADNAGLANWAKRLLVALPGKFAQRQRRWVYAPEHSTDVFYGEWFGSDKDGCPCRYRAIAGQVYRDEIGGWGTESVPAIAGWVTSEARLKLLAAIRVAGWGDTYYCDTDSIMVSDSGLQRLVAHGDVRHGVLGYLYPKTDRSAVALYGAKHYVEDERTVCAGLPRGAVHSADGGSTYWRNVSPTDRIVKGMRPDAEQQKVSYNYHAPYRGGIVDTDGHVMPFVLEEF